MSSDTITFSLSRPLDMGGEALSELVLRRPLCSDMEDLSWGDLYGQLGDAYRTLVPRICTSGISEEDLDRLHISDLFEIYARVFVWFATPPAKPQFVELNQQEENVVVHPLSIPFENASGKSIKTVTLRSPTASDLNNIAFGKIYRRLISPYCTLIPRLTDDLNQEDIDSLDPFDLFEIMAIIFLFFHSRQDTGPRAPVGTTSAQ